MKKNLLYAALLVLVSCAPQPAQAVTFDPSVRYSRLVIDNCIYHFKANETAAGFAKYDETGALVSASESSRGFDYVPGLVAKAVLECVDYYQDSTWAAPWFYSMQAYGEAYYSGPYLQFRGEAKICQPRLQSTFRSFSFLFPFIIFLRKPNDIAATSSSA